MAETPIWMQDSKASDIPKEKLEFLRNFVEGSRGKSQIEMMLYMMQSMKIAKANGISFSKEELSLLMEIIKKYASPDELAKVEQLLKSNPTDKKKAPL